MDIIAEWLPRGLGSAPAALLIVASFFTSALTAAFGLGGGVAMLALMGLFIPVAALIPVHGAVQLGSNSGRAWHQRANVRMDVAVPFIAGSIVGAIAGAFIVVQLPDAVLKLVLGTFIIAVTWTKIPGIETLGRAGLALASAVLAMTTMFVGATGPLLSSVFAQIFPNDRKALVATHGAAMTVQHGLKIVVFGLAGFAFWQWLPLVAAMIRFRLPWNGPWYEMAGSVAGEHVPQMVPGRDHHPRARPFAAGAGGALLRASLKIRQGVAKMVTLRTGAKCTCRYMRLDKRKNCHCSRAWRILSEAPRLNPRSGELPVPIRRQRYATSRTAQTHGARRSRADGAPR